MNIKNPASLMQNFMVVHDPRLDRNKEHNLLDIIGITICAVICGADDWVEIAEFGRAKRKWLKTFMTLSNGIPSHDTFGRVFALLDPDQFQAGFASWVKGVCNLAVGEVVPIDGKTIRRAYEKDGNPLHVISAFASANGVTLGQKVTDKKSNEITAIPKLLKTLQLAGCIITIDAMGCQKKIAKIILEGGADYVLAVKGNQKTIHQDMQHLFAEDEVDKHAGDYFETSERSAGREEVRICRTITDEELLPHGNCKRYDWPGLTCLAQVTNQRTVNGKTITENRYYLSSLSGKAEQIMKAVRSHWSIENNLHWSLDVSFREDESRVRLGHAQENFTLVRKLALGLLKKETTAKIGIAAKRMKAGWSNKYLCQVLGVNKKVN